MIKKYSTGHRCDMVLVSEKDNTPLEIGKQYMAFDGEVLLLLGASPPHKPSSSGFVTVASKVEPDVLSCDVTEYYVSVIGAKWVKV